MLTLTDGQGKRVQLAAEIGRGGEAVVYNVRGHDKLVAKLYLPGKQDEGAKISSMLAIADPRLRSLGAWPTDTLRDGGKIAGFLMPKITGHRSLFDLTVPKLRLREFPKADWRFLIRTAENTARAFHFIHQAGVVIGDVNHSNLLVANDATIRCIDCDSFQITANAQHWLCRVGMGDYQPPEMQGLASYQGIVRTPNHDNFGLAVIIFRLLFAGRHPFSGRWQGQGDAPSIEEAIKACRYVYSQRRKTGFQPPGSALSVDVLPDKVRDMFERAFDPRATNGGRPTAEHWMTALQALGRTVRQCRTNRFHWFYSGATNCPWCEIEALGGVTLFGGTVQPPPPRQQPQPQPQRQASPGPQAPHPMAQVRRKLSGSYKYWLAAFAVILCTGLISIANNPTRPSPQQVAPSQSQDGPTTTLAASSTPTFLTARHPPSLPSSPPAISPSPAPGPVPAPPPDAGSSQATPVAPVSFEQPNGAVFAEAEKLQRYRSEFFSKLRVALANRPGSRVAGDRFVFQSEGLFPVGSAEVTPAGQASIAMLAITIKDIAAEIPLDIQWIVRVDGHTDRQPIKGNGSFASNWELSAERAIMVVKLLIADGVPPQHVAATTFAGYQPLDPADTQEAYTKNRRIELRLTDG